MKAMDCAVILLEHADKLEIDVTNLQLQKYLHFINARFFRDKQRPLVEDKFETWTYGPVIPCLYNHFKFYGSNPIDVNFERTRLEQFNNAIPDDGSAEYLKNNMDRFLRNLSAQNIFDLVNITHEEPIWAEHREEILRGTHYTYSDKDFMNVQNIL